MKDPQSIFGKLYFKFQNSGFRGHEIITTDELKQLFDLCQEMDRTMMDIQDLPSAFYFRLIGQSVESGIRARFFGV